MGGQATSQSVLVAVLLAAAVDVVGMAVIDIVINGRYTLANRAEAKRRRWAETQRTPPLGTERPPSASEV
jgi:hypothetical protein